MSETRGGMRAAPGWAEAVPEVGKGVYRLTQGPEENKHYYHTESPFSGDGCFVVYLRYRPGKDEAEVCVMDLESGRVRVVGCTTEWSDHTAATQHWLGDRPRVIYKALDEQGPKFVTVGAGGEDVREHRQDLVFHNSSCDGRYSFGRSTIQQLWPQDTVAPRHDKGLFRLDHDTGECELVASLEEILDLHPLRKEIRHCHLMVVQIVSHFSLQRVLFVVHNMGFYEGAGERPRVKAIYSVDADGANLRFLGPFGDHPIWHPKEDRVLANMPRMPGGRAFALFAGDGGEPVTFIAGCDGGGHPSFRPDGSSILTDRYYSRGGERRISVVHCDLEAGGETVLADFLNPCHTKAYHHGLKNRPAGTYLVDVLAGTNTMHDPPLVTQAHPAWSRDGRFVLFNGDDTGGSQLYLVDVEEARAR